MQDASQDELENLALSIRAQLEEGASKRSVAASLIEAESIQAWLAGGVIPIHNALSETAR